jgi:hypothetical protein
MDTGGPRILTQSFGYVKGIGCRWPANLPARVGPTFDDIYGKDTEVLR